MMPSGGIFQAAGFDTCLRHSYAASILSPNFIEISNCSPFLSDSRPSITSSLESFRSFCDSRRSYSRRRSSKPSKFRHRSELKPRNKVSSQSSESSENSKSHLSTRKTSNTLKAHRLSRRRGDRKNRNLRKRSKRSRRRSRSPEKGNLSKENRSSTRSFNSRASSYNSKDGSTSKNHERKKKENKEDCDLRTSKTDAEIKKKISGTSSSSATFDSNKAVVGSSSDEKRRAQKKAENKGSTSLNSPTSACGESFKVPQSPFCFIPEKKVERSLEEVLGEIKFVPHRDPVLVDLVVEGKLAESLEGFRFQKVVFTSSQVCSMARKFSKEWKVKKMKESSDGNPRLLAEGFYGEKWFRKFCFRNPSVRSVVDGFEGHWKYNCRCASKEKVEVAFRQFAEKVFVTQKEVQ